jgi:hypothetical protein
MVEKKKSLETVEELQKQITENAEKIRQMKRADSELNLQMAVQKINSEEEKDQREILRACYSYIAQHRALFPKHRFKKLDNTD